MENVVFQRVRIFQYCAWVREYFFKIPFRGWSLWYFSPFKPISQTGILSYFDLGHFLGLHWLSGKNQDWAKKLACLATKFQFLRAGALGNLSKGSAGLEILKIRHGLAKKRDFRGVVYLPTETWPNHVRLSKFQGPLRLLIGFLVRQPSKIEIW